MAAHGAVIYWPIYTYFSPAGSWLSFSKRLRIRVRRRDNRRICLFALDGAKSWRYRCISRRDAALEGRNRHMVPGLEARRAILALQVLLGDLDIQQGHVGIVMAQQFHQGG